MSLKFSGKTALSVGMVAAAGASACCIGPLLLLALGIGGAWAGGAALEQYRCLFIALTFVFLGTAYGNCTGGHRLAPPMCLVPSRRPSTSGGFHSGSSWDFRWL